MKNIEGKWGNEKKLRKIFKGCWFKKKKWGARPSLERKGTKTERIGGGWEKSIGRKK